MNARREVFASSIRSFFHPVTAFFEDESVSEIMINGPNQIYVERRGRLELTQARFASSEKLLAALRNLSQYMGRELGPRAPILEARLPDGARVEAIVPPASPHGPMVSIRRFSREPLSIDELVALGSLPAEPAELLKGLIAEKQNIVIAGGTGSGKSSLLNALSALMPQSARVLVIEDTSELRIPLPHVVYLEAQPADSRGLGAVSIRELFRASLRMRPDRVVLGEIRGAEAVELIQAMTSGHAGCLSTIHASYPWDALHKLETMALMSDLDIPLSALRSQIASAVDVIIQMARLADGSRRVTHVTEVLELGAQGAQGGYGLRSLYELGGDRSPVDDAS